MKRVRVRDNAPDPEVLDVYVKDKSTLKDGIYLLRLVESLNLGKDSYRLARVDIEKDRVDVYNTKFKQTNSCASIAGFLDSCSDSYNIVAKLEDSDWEG